MSQLTDAEWLALEDQKFEEYLTSEFNTAFSWASAETRSQLAKAIVNVYKTHDENGVVDYEGREPTQEEEHANSLIEVVEIQSNGRLSFWQVYETIEEILSREPDHDMPE